MRSAESCFESINDNFMCSTIMRHSRFVQYLLLTRKVLIADSFPFVCRAFLSHLSSDALSFLLHMSCVCELTYTSSSLRALSERSAEQGSLYQTGNELCTYIKAGKLFIFFYFSISISALYLSTLYKYEMKLYFPFFFSHESCVDIFLKPCWNFL